jgi:membrane dipeptidase
MLKVFDGHNDVLLRLWLKKLPSPESEFIEGDGKGQMDLPRMVKGGFAGGFFAIFVPSPDDVHPDEDDPNPPLASKVSTQPALCETVEMASILLRIERQIPDRFKVCRSAADIRSAIAKGQIAAIMHIEGAECIGAGLRSLDVLHAAGLRSVGPVWSRPNIFGHGVPFRFPSSPDTGPGLTDSGKALIKRCNELRILIDLSHINEKGFWEVAELSSAPLIATHSNAHVLCATSRNLTDAQLRAIGTSGGIVGLNFANGFLREDGRRRGDFGLDILLRHLDYMIKMAGEDHVGLGSDFDGAPIPDAIADVAGLPNLTEAIGAHFGETLGRKICVENWVRVLERTWGA